MYDPEKGFPRVVVELAYADPDRAVEWLVEVFGFRLLLRQPVSGTIHHADLDTGGGIVMVRGADERFTCTDGHTCKQTIVWVPDVDKHCELSTAAGAQPLHPPVDKPWGLRQYLVRDIEGHLWEFTQHMRDVAPEEWGATAVA
ncbi:VOC family protein [Streptomyces pratensis]|uniref:VOC family protein n=1 Tax=Streptomyces pratensis TaxID=1169025 RepID=UPI001933482E|nr:VOC family protein [Streptomyces pratensis]